MSLSHSQTEEINMQILHKIRMYIADCLCWGVVMELHGWVKSHGIYNKQQGYKNATRGTEIST